MAKVNVTIGQIIYKVDSRLRVFDIKTIIIMAAVKTGLRERRRGTEGSILTSFKFTLMKRGTNCKGYEFNNILPRHIT